MILDVQIKNLIDELQKIPEEYWYFFNLYSNVADNDYVQTIINKYYKNIYKSKSELLDLFINEFNNVKITESIFNTWYNIITNLVKTFVLKLQRVFTLKVTSQEKEAAILIIQLCDNIVSIKNFDINILHTEIDDKLLEQIKIWINKITIERKTVIEEIHRIVILMSITEILDINELQTANSIVESIINSNQALNNKEIHNLLISIREIVIDIIKNSNSYEEIHNITLYIENILSELPQHIVTRWIKFINKTLSFPINLDEEIESISFLNKTENIIKTAKLIYFSLKEYKNFIANIAKQISKVKPEAPKGAIFDRYLFADQRKFEVPEEPNTDNETFLFNSLLNHFELNTPIPKIDAEILKAILKSNLYNNIIHKPTQSFVYRGMGVSDTYLKRALNLKENEILQESGDLEVKFTYKPKNNIYVSSWTNDANEALKASENNAHFYSLIMIAETVDNQNLIDCSDLYKIKGLSTYKNEKEVLAIGIVKVSHIMWKLNKF